MAKVLFEIELGALGQNRVYGKSQLVFGAPNGQIMLCFELNRRHVVEQHSFQRAFPNLPFFYVDRTVLVAVQRPLHQRTGSAVPLACGCAAAAAAGARGGAPHIQI